MTDIVWKLAGKADSYPMRGKLIDLVIRDLFATGFTADDAAGAAETVFGALAKADVLGYISHGDEHEWARLSLECRELMNG